MGRTLLPSDEIAPGRHPVVVISDGLWRRDFGADPDIVGKTVEINNYPLTVVGVADPTFHGTIVSYDVEVFIPVMMAPQLGFTFGSQQTTPSGILADRRAGVFYPHGYLRPGTTSRSAAPQTDALWADALARSAARRMPTQRLRVVPFWQIAGQRPEHMLPTLIVLSAMGLLVLMIACANIAGLVLVRGVSRRGEIAVRLALGATRARIVRLLIVENLVLARARRRARRPARAARDPDACRATPSGSPRRERIFFNIEVDGLVIGFAALVACGSALVFGFVPALQSSRVDLVSVINEDASPRGAARGRLRAGLVVAQVAVSLLLLVGAGLATRSVEAARRANPGFDASHVTAIEVDVKQNAYDEPRGRVFYRSLLDAARADRRRRIGHARRVHAAGVARDAHRSAWRSRATTPRRGEDLAFMSNTVGSDYFRTLRIPLTAGREFEDRDDETARAGGDRQQHARAAVLGRRGERDRQADPRRRGRLADRGRRGGGREVLADQRSTAPVLLPAVPAVVPVEHDPAHQGAGVQSIVLVDQARARVAALDPDLPILHRQADGSIDPRGADLLRT